MRRFIIILCIFLTKNFIGQFFNYNGNIKENMKIEYNLKNTHKMYWLKIIDTLPKKTQKYIILKYKQNAKKKLVIFDSPHYSLNKLNSKKLYLILVDVNTLKLTAQTYLENLFEKSQLSWKKIYFLIFNTIMCTKACIFRQIPYLQTKYFFQNLKSYFSTMFVFL